MPHTTTTLEGLRTDLVARWTSSAFWTNADANRGINEALQLWNLLTGVWRSRAILTTMAATPLHALPSTLVYGARVMVAEHPVVGTSLATLNTLHPNWRGETTTSGGAVPTRVAAWAPVGLAQLVLWPADNAGGQQITVDGVEATPVLTTDGALINLSEAEHSALLDYALHYAAFKEGGPRFAETRTHLQRFLRAAADQNARLLASARFRAWAGLDRDRGLRPDRQAPARGASQV